MKTAPSSSIGSICLMNSVLRLGPTASAISLSRMVRSGVFTSITGACFREDSRAAGITTTSWRARNAQSIDDGKMGGVLSARRSNY